MKIAAFTDLEIWKEAIRLSKIVYQQTSKGSFSKDFGLKDQIRKSMVSIGSNIAEGFERNSPAEFRKFLTYAKGSGAEARTQVYIAMEIGYLSKEEGEIVANELKQLCARIGKLMARISETRNP